MVECTVSLTRRGYWNGSPAVRGVGSSARDGIYAVCLRPEPEFPISWWGTNSSASEQINGCWSVTTSSIDGAPLSLN
jgi:hypothetical protein